LRLCAGDGTGTDGDLNITKVGGTDVVFAIIGATGSPRFWGALTSGAAAVTARPTFANGSTVLQLAQVLERYGILEVTGE
jgi:hypothetical protein